MLSEVFLTAFADYYGSFTLDEVAERMGLPTVELVGEFEYYIDQNLDCIEDEMSIDEKKELEDEDQ